MKKYRYSCDGGSLMIGNADFACHYPNEYGDGTHTVIVSEVNEVKTPQDLYKFVGCVIGKAKVYNYDCYDEKEREDPENVLCELNGRYGVYAKKGDCGDMLIEHWRD